MTDPIRLKQSIGYWRCSHLYMTDEGFREVVDAAERDLLKQGPTIWRSSQMANWPMQQAGAKRLGELIRDLAMLKDGRIGFAVPLADVAQEIWVAMEMAR